MSRRLATFTSLDIERAMRGAQKAGFSVARCEIKPDGTILVVTMDGAGLDAGAAEGVDSELSPLDRWRLKRDARRKTAAIG